MQSHKKKERDEGKNEGGALPREAGLHMDIYAAPPSPPEFLVTPMLMGPVCRASRPLIIRHYTLDKALCGYTHTHSFISNIGHPLDRPQQYY